MASLSDFLNEWHSQELYVTAHSSGSTGAPKEIKLLKSDMLVSATATNSFFKINSSSVLGIPLSMDYIAGKMMAVRADVAGCRLLVMPVSNNLKIDEQIDLLSVVPSQIESVLNNPDACNKIRNLLIGGAPLNEYLQNKVIASGINAYIGYGMTETCSHVAIRNVKDCYYHAMAGITFSIDDRNCLVINSNSFSWKVLITNDVVNLVSPTKFEWIGRADNVINSGGIKIHPEQLEVIIRQQLPNFPPFYIVGDINEKLGECVAIVIQYEGDYINNFIEQLSSIELPQYWQPKVILAVNALPLTKNGKLRRLPPSVIQTC